MEPDAEDGEHGLDGLLGHLTVQRRVRRKFGHLPGPEKVEGVIRDFELCAYERTGLANLFSTWSVYFLAFDFFGEPPELIPGDGVSDDVALTVPCWEIQACRDEFSSV